MASSFVQDWISICIDNSYLNALTIADFLIHLTQRVLYMMVDFAIPLRPSFRQLEPTLIRTFIRCLLQSLCFFRPEIHYRHKKPEAVFCFCMWIINNSTNSYKCLTQLSLVTSCVPLQIKAVILRPSVVAILVAINIGTIVIVLCDSLSETCGRSVVFFRVLRFPPQLNWVRVIVV